MKSVVCTILCLFWCSRFCQADPLTPDQARQTLLSYVQIPDAALTVVPGISLNQDGHTEYLFHGDDGIAGSNTGGYYGIDAVTGAKSITFSGLSVADGNAQTPSSHLTEMQLQQAALNYVSQHFPNYFPGMLSMSAGMVDAIYDADEYYVDFTIPVASGAEVPVHCQVIVEEDTGKIKFYGELNLPISVSTNPAITQSQAVQLGQNWIARNISTDPLPSQLNNNIGPRSPIRFKIVVDAFLNQTLVYDISYNALALVIDAQSGSVLDTESYASFSSSARFGPKSAPLSREHFWAMKMQIGKQQAQVIDKFTHAAIHTQGQTFLWSGYLKPAGIRVTRQNGGLILRSGKKALPLKSLRTATTNSRTAWERKDGFYVPLVAVRTLTSVFTEIPPSQEVLIVLQSVKRARQ